MKFYRIIFWDIFCCSFSSYVQLTKLCYCPIASSDSSRVKGKFIGIIQCGAQLGDLKALLLRDISVGREIRTSPL